MAEWGGSVPAAPVPSRPLAWQGPRSQHLRDWPGAAHTLLLLGRMAGSLAVGRHPLQACGRASPCAPGSVRGLGGAWTTRLGCDVIVPGRTRSRGGHGEASQIPAFPWSPSSHTGEKLCGCEGWDAGHWLLGVWNLLCPLMTPGHAQWPLCPRTCSGTLTPAATSSSFHFSASLLRPQGSHG